MPTSPACERAIEIARKQGRALLKFISANDVGATGTHQCGFYLPKNAWKMFTPHPPKKGANKKHEVEIVWMDGRITDSVITWYGQLTRSEYRLTRFGKDFPFLVSDFIGDLFVLIPTSRDSFEAYVLDSSEDIEVIQAALGVEAIEGWAVYDQEAPKVESEDECVNRHFREFVKALTSFPSGDVFSQETREVLRKCCENFRRWNEDDSLLNLIETEYSLFRMAERQICQSQIVRIFRDVDDFLRTASSIMNRRKSRAGRSLENHFHHLLTEAKIPHTMRPSSIEGQPDVVIPSEEAYLDRRYPRDKIWIVGVKTTCKDRWRQVLREGSGVSVRYLLTLQAGISSNQLIQMQASQVSLIVPSRIQKTYPRAHSGALLSVSAFLKSVIGTLRA